MSVRVAHLLTLVRLEEGGVVRAVLDQAGILAERGMDINLFTLDDKDAPEAWKQGQAGTPRVRLLPGGRQRFQSMTAEAVRAFRAQLSGVDVVHLHGAWEYANIQAMQVCRALGVPYVVSAHGMLDDWTLEQKSLKKKLFLLVKGYRAFGNAAALHATASMEREQIIRNLRKVRRVETIPLLMDISGYQELPGEGLARERLAGQLGDRPFVLFLSRVHYKKGVDIAIRAIKRLAEQSSDGRTLLCDLAIAGTGDEDYVQAMRDLANELGVADRVHFLGMVRGDAKLSLYQAAAAMVLPTSQENFGLVLPESMACCTPVITTKGTDIWPDLQASGGAIIAERTPEAFAQAIAELLADKARRDAMGQAGRAWVLATLAPEAVARRYEAFYQEVAQASHER